MDYSQISVPKVKGLSHAIIEARAEDFLKLMSPECLQIPMATPVLNIFEDKLDRLGFKALYGKNVKGLGGVTNVTNKYVELTSSTHSKLEKDVPRARFTAAHEFGHVVLHGNNTEQEAFPSMDEVIYARRSELRPFEDPEWQADNFAACILMPKKTMRMLYISGQMTVENVMAVYQVSKPAASRRIMRLSAEFGN